MDEVWNGYLWLDGRAPSREWHWQIQLKIEWRGVRWGSYLLRYSGALDGVSDHKILSQVVCRLCCLSDLTRKGGQGFFFSHVKTMLLSIMAIRLTSAILEQ